MIAEYNIITIDTHYLYRFNAETVRLGVAEVIDNVANNNCNIIY